MTTNQTIAALSTPQGEGAIGIIRLSGPAAISIAAMHFSKDLARLEAGNATFGRFAVNDQMLDEVVLTLFRTPHSYTGEDVIEFSFHGSSYILGQALEALLQSGAALAQPGEFTQRAFLNGKMDLSQAEAVADLIASESEAEHRLAMHQMRGGFSKEIEKLREELIHFASLIELELDFSEEDVEFANRDELQQLIEKIQGFIRSLIQTFRYGNAVKNGVPVAIIGKPNAGKSTLLNALLHEERAIVSEIAGTTRDTIEDVAVIEGIRFRFIDTAGIRETTDTIEIIGVRKSLEKMKSAAIVLYLFDARESTTDVTAQTEQIRTDIGNNILITVANKSDLASEHASLVSADVTISAKEGTGLDTLCTLLSERMQAGKLQSGDVIVTNTRHMEALQKTDTSLIRALEALISGLSGDLVATDIREALHHLGSITGQITTDDLLGNIFGKFCIGK